MKRCLTCRNTFDAGDWRCPHCGWKPDSDGYLSFTPAEAVEAFDAELVNVLARVEDSNFWFAARRDLIAWVLRSYFPQARSFLEVGCGTGHVLAGIHRTLPALEIAGGEPSAAALAVARRRLPGVPLFQLDARTLPFASEFDVVGAFDVLEHVDEDDTVLRELREATRPGGGLVVTVPQHPRLWSAMDDIAGHVRRYTRNALLTKVAAAGFRPLRVTSFVALLLPALTLSRLRYRGSRTYSVESELALPPRADRVLRSVMAFERALITRGISFPAGGSLLVVAQRP